MSVFLPDRPPVRLVGTSRFSPAYADAQLLAIEGGVPVDEIVELVEMAALLREHGAPRGDAVLSVPRPPGMARIQAVAEFTDHGTDVWAIGTVHTISQSAKNAIARKLLFRRDERVSSADVRDNGQLSVLNQIPYGAPQRQSIADANVHAASTDVIEAARRMLWADFAVREVEAASESLLRRIELGDRIFSNIKAGNFRRNPPLFEELRQLRETRMDWPNGVRPPYQTLVATRDAFEALFVLRAAGVGVNHTNEPSLSLEDLFQAGIDHTIYEVGVTSPAGEALLAIRSQVMPDTDIFFRGAGLEIDVS